MTVLNYSEFRSNLKSVCDQVVNDCDTTVIHRRDAENVILMSESEFNSWKETVYLMSTPANAKWLMDSIAQAERGKLLQKDLLEDEF
ncbi:type II toxin-antitoxin system Phd/YefM family antitoxin [Aliivibrio fischeri]|uniref:Antitoxin n=1 Tax=Aliivibrio fischeri TaxID=668 RepID=A0A510UMR3_ALIFS|nr:type II toxin-antitoxin system Phd/YefM family antitoxin [Aliivibrio fischeri]GEK15904.1 antitoxin [Aliivibrio fischeri]